MHDGIALILAVLAVGVLHTIVPDHWAPIVVLARARGWSTLRVARAAALAGLGHVTTTLILGAIVWIGGAALAKHYAHYVSLGSAIALIALGLWIAYAGWKEAREHDHHSHQDAGTGRMAWLLLLGSSPMVEGIPAFLSASTKGPALLGVMALVFAASTIATYVAMCVAALHGLQKASLGPLERYGEVLSGLFVALVGVYALVTG